MHDPRARCGRLLRSLTLLLSLLLLAAPLQATWSIVVVNTKTGEVCVGTATCLTNFDIQKAVPVIVPGFGGGASQSLIDSAAVNRKIIVEGLVGGLTPDEILVNLSGVNGFQARQFGIVNFPDAPVTFTGNNAGDAKGGVAGSAGDLRYAIQGNVLTGPEVWLNAESALVNTPGDLSQKVMAAMEAARSFGGDGRCSCTTGTPTSCGAPPMGGFTKSAHCAYVGLARLGDSAGPCNSATGCAAGEYFLSLNVIGGNPDPDPVLVLQGLYDAWRLGQVGLPDQLNSSVVPSAQSIVADGNTSLRVDVQLGDIEGTPLTVGGADITLERISGGVPVSTPSSVVDKGNGSYSFQVRAGLLPGTDVWRVRVATPGYSVALQPDVVVRVDPRTQLHFGLDALSAGAGATLPITLNLGKQLAGTPYQILASASGTTPGTTLGGLAIPLNVDLLYLLSLNPNGSGLFVNTLGVLDAGGRAQAAFRPSPGLLSASAGGQLDWAVLVRASPPFVVGPQGLVVLP